MDNSINKELKKEQQKSEGTHSVIGDGNPASDYKFFNTELVPWTEKESHTEITIQLEESKEKI